MNRQSKFRGKSELSLEELNELGIKYVGDGWVYGNLITNRSGYMMIVGDIIDATDEYAELEYWVTVRPDSVGQYTGFEDKNGQEIYEGDIVKWIDSDYNVRIDTVVWRNGGLVLCNPRYTIGAYIANKMTVIGNVTENPELITAKKIDYAE